MSPSTPLALLVLAAPHRPGATAALERARAAAAEPGVRLVFFQGDGVLAALDPDLGAQWRSLGRTYGVPLELCVSSAEARNVAGDAQAEDDTPGAFRIAGLAQLVVAGMGARIESFP